MASGPFEHIREYRTYSKQFSRARFSLAAARMGGEPAPLSELAERSGNRVFDGAECALREPLAAEFVVFNLQPKVLIVLGLLTNIVGLQ